MKHPIKVPPELFTELFAEWFKQYKEQVAKELLHLRQEMKRHGLDVPTTPALARALESIPDADS
jgi:hypothetical protein